MKRSVNILNKGVAKIGLNFGVIKTIPNPICSNLLLNNGQKRTISILVQQLCRTSKEIEVMSGKRKIERTPENKDKSPEQIKAEIAERTQMEVKYHDDEWGKPVREDLKLFELMVLELFQSGLSWLTILSKRDAFKQAFDNFDIKKISEYDDKRVTSLLDNPAIIRNRRKIEAVVTNAKESLKVIEEYGSLSKYFWSFVPDGKPMASAVSDIKLVQTTSLQSDTLAADLHRRGFRWMGPTTCYAFMQSAGMLNDHLITCFRHKELVEIAANEQGNANAQKPAASQPTQDNK